VERNQQIRDGGYAIDVRGSATEILHRMNLYDQAVSLDTNMKTVAFVDPKSAKQSVIDAALFGGRTENNLEIMRGDLVDLLYKNVGKNVIWKFGDSIESLSEDGDSMHVTFASGETGKYSLVIGADGIHSRSRHLIFGDESSYIKPLHAKIAIATIPNILKLDHEEKLYAEVGKSVFLYSSKANAAKAMFLWSDKNTAPNASLDQQKNVLNDIYHNVHAWKVPDVLVSAIESNDFYLDTMATLTIPTYSKGRYVLLGDAGYSASPSSGQATSLALIGADILAGELQATRDHAQAFRSYETIMRPFAEKNQALAPLALHGMIMKNKFFIVMRDLMLHSPKLFAAMNKPVLDRIQKAAYIDNLPRYS
jgi:2-polyprenyl-6-methoxyphenol hydroxylase-like FAD-dependent oxidoreductase